MSDQAQTLEVGAYDADSDTIMIEGTRYAGVVFRGLGLAGLLGEVFHRVGHNGDTVTIRSIAAGSFLSGAVCDVLLERQRQVRDKGWTPAHDDDHAGGELARAGACYALAASAFRAEENEMASTFIDLAVTLFPWPEGIKPGTRRRHLVKAAALILAEMDRLDRIAASVPESVQ
jgi:hypothetical protein